MTDGLGESIMGEVANLLNPSGRTLDSDYIEEDTFTDPDDPSVQKAIEQEQASNNPEGEGPDIDTPIMAPVQTKVKKADTIKVKETPAQAQRKSVAQSRKKANTAGVSGVSSTGGSGVSIVGA